MDTSCVRELVGLRHCYGRVVKWGGGQGWVCKTRLLFGFVHRPPTPHYLLTCSPLSLLFSRHLIYPSSIYAALCQPKGRRTLLRLSSSSSSSIHPSSYQYTCRNEVAESYWEIPRGQRLSIFKHRERNCLGFQIHVRRGGLLSSFDSLANHPRSRLQLPSMFNPCYLCLQSMAVSLSQDASHRVQVWSPHVKLPPKQNNEMLRMLGLEV